MGGKATAIGGIALGDLGIGRIGRHHAAIGEADQRDTPGVDFRPRRKVVEGGVGVGQEHRLGDLQQAIDEPARSEEHTSELQSLMRNSYAVFCLKKKTHTYNTQSYNINTYR